MKRRYKKLLLVILVEYVLGLILMENYIKIQSFIGSAIGVFVFFLPIQILLFLLSNDDNISNTKRIIAKIVFWFICSCYLCAIIAGISMAISERLA